MSPVLKLATRNLLRNRRRSITLLLTLAMGTAAVFIFHGFNAGVMNEYRDGTIRARYGSGQINTRGYRDEPFEKPWEHWIQDYPGLQAPLQKAFPKAQLFPRIEFFALLSTGATTVSGRGQGVDGAAEAKFFTAMNVEVGVTLSDQADGILLGRGLARALRVKPGDRVTLVGNTIHGSMNAIDTTVTGVFHTGLREFDDAFFRIPIAEAKRLLDTSAVESVALGLDRLEDWPMLASWVKTNRPDLEATSFAKLDEVYYQHSVDWLDSQFGVIQAIILLMVLLGIFNTVSAAVLERRPEIGNLRANGESVGDVMKLLAAEGVFVGCLGGVLGIVIAVFAAEVLLSKGILMPPAPGITRQFAVHIQLQFFEAFKAIGMGLGTAVLATLMAGYRVVRQPIAELLRSI